MTANATESMMEQPAPLDCLFRSSVEGDGADESADCLLLSRILSVDAEHCRVARPLCEACMKHVGGQAFANHPVFPSYVFQLATEQQFRSTDSRSAAHWSRWVAKAEAAILQSSQTPSPARVISECDVILSVSDPASPWRSVLNSLLEQEDAVPIVHLIVRRDVPLDLSQYTPRWNILIHACDEVLKPVEAAVQLAPSLMTEYLAFPSEYHPCAVGWLAGAVRQLRESGAVVTAAHIQQDEAADAAVGQWTILPHTVVLRRAALADMLGRNLVAEHSLAEIVLCAIQQKQRVEFDAWNGSERAGAVTVSAIATRPIVANSQSKRRSQNPKVAARCDVVLPFHGHLDYVREALESLLQQDRATAIIHLIDDATPEETSAFLNEWARHPQLRVYRNRENIGQFQSFNNVAGYWETDLVAVQDADDISLPHRLDWAATLLHDSGADYFGAAVELFGDEAVIRPVMHECLVLERTPRAGYRHSFYPEWSRTDYFLENPTAVFRTAMFREMGGYADFGDRLMNRTSLDTEFQLRCLYSRVRFVISQDVVTRYRVHPSSATQDRATGWGSVARSESIRQLEARCQWFRDRQFDPRPFGALGRYTHLTERWHGSP